MSRSRMYMPLDRIKAGEALLDGEAYRHLRRVQRLTPGDRVQLFDGFGHEADATIVHDDGRQLRLAVEKPRRAPSLPGPRITLVCGLLKGDKMDWVVQKATELGVDRLVPVLSERSVPRPSAESAARRLERHQRIAQEACRQCGRAWLPNLCAPQALSGLLQELDVDLAVLCWEVAPEASGLRGYLAHADWEHVASVALLTGPEGGFTAGEVSLAERYHFQPVSLGPLILRAETAAIAALTLVSAEVGRLG